MFDRVREMLIKEFIQVFRDPKMRGVILILPCIEVIVIGYAVNMDIRHIRAAIYDQDNTPASRELLARFSGNGYFDVVARVKGDREMDDLVNRSQVQIVFRVDQGFQGDLESGRTAQLQVICDGTDSNTAGIALSYVSGITGDYTRAMLQRRLDRSQSVAGVPVRLDFRTRAWFNENLDSRNYFVPGVIVIVVSLVSLLLTSMAVVREKEIGTIEQIMVTPITPVEFILGKTLPFVLIAFVDVTLILLIGKFWFQVPLRGSLVLLYFSTGLYLLTMLGAGLLISTISQTQQQALMSTFLFFFPAMLLSGFSFPIANMPQVIQWLTYLNPVAYFLVVVRTIFLKGVGLAYLWPQLASLALIGMATFFLAVKRFHKTL
jgi:ABC-2 type transport system permease protein